MSLQVPLDSLAETLEATPKIWVRMAASLEEDWLIRVLEVTTGEPPPAWKPRRWVYPNAILMSLTREGRQVAKWLRSRKISVRPYQISLEGIADTAYVDRRESHWPGLYEPLEWPSDEWRLSYRQEYTRQPPDDLVSDDAPSFITFDVAASCLLGVESSSVRNFSGNELVVRCQDMSGRLQRVRIRPAELEIRVEGHQLRDATVEVAGTKPGPTYRFTRNAPRTVKFMLPEGVAPGTWVLLRRGNAWIDRRFLSWPYATAHQAGVDYVVEPSTRLEVLVAGGEGPTTEFKASLPGGDDESKRKVMKTVAAFANGSGGSIVFGVTDVGEAVGVAPADAGPKARDRLSGLIRDWVSPLVRFDVESVAVREGSPRRALVLQVEQGDTPPYGAGTHPTNLVYYVRRGATSFPISPHEVRQLARSRPQVNQPFGVPRYPDNLA